VAGILPTGACATWKQSADAPQPQPWFWTNSGGSQTSDRHTNQTLSVSIVAPHKNRWEWGDHPWKQACHQQCFREQLFTSLIFGSQLKHKSHHNWTVIDKHWQVAASASILSSSASWLLDCQIDPSIQWNMLVSSNCFACQRFECIGFFGSSIGTILTNLNCFLPAQTILISWYTDHCFCLQAQSAVTFRRECPSKL
jgi:hypothetical protein